LLQCYIESTGKWDHIGWPVRMRAELVHAWDCVNALVTAGISGEISNNQLLSATIRA
jgi:hypothetical protein